MELTGWEHPPNSSSGELLPKPQPVSTQLGLPDGQTSIELSIPQWFEKPGSVACPTAQLLVVPPLSPSVSPVQ